MGRMLALILFSMPLVVAAQGQSGYDAQGGRSPSLPITRTGTTFDASIAMGAMVTRDDNAGSGSEDRSLAVDGGVGFGLGLGMWLGSRVVVGARMSMLYYGAKPLAVDNHSRSILAGVLAPNLQYWIDDHLWVGTGLGLALTLQGGYSDRASLRLREGYGFNVRVGYAFSSGSTSTAEASIEIAPGLYRDGGGSLRNGELIPVLLQFGYRYL
jgi:hypothetical protein